MYCVSCNNPLKPDTRFCNKCGTVQNIDAAPMPGQQQVPHHPVRQQFQKATTAVLQPLSSKWIYWVAGGIILFFLFLAILTNLDNAPRTVHQGLGGTWIRTSTSGNFPDSTPRQIVFTGEGISGSGHFIDEFWGTRINFTWSLQDGIFLSRVPGGEGIIGMTGYTRFELNGERTVLIFRYPNGSSATFTRQ